MERPCAGRHYPRSVGEFQSWFRTDADCLDYLEWLRWPDGFVCPRCDHAGEVLPAVHRVASLIKRWLLGTHQGSVDAEHLLAYMNEFVFRFNRRTSHSRGMIFYRLLQLAVDHDPIRYKNLIVTRQPGKTPPRPPVSRGTPPSLDRPRANQPWRTSSLQ